MADVFLPQSYPGNVRDLVLYYFSVRPKLKYKDICSIISVHHSKRITMYRIKSILKLEGLNKKRNVSDVVLKSIIENEMQTSLSNVGYRQMTENICLKYDINISREDVRKVLKEVLLFV